MAGVQKNDLKESSAFITLLDSFSSISRGISQASQNRKEIPHRCPSGAIELQEDALQYTMQVEQQEQERPAESASQQQQQQSGEAQQSPAAAMSKQPDGQPAGQQASQELQDGQQQQHTNGTAGPSESTTGNDVSNADQSLHDDDSGHAAAEQQQQHQEEGDGSETHMSGGLGYSMPLSGDPLMIIDKSKIPRPYKCPFPNCDKAFYRLEQ